MISLCFGFLLGGFDMKIKSKIGDGLFIGLVVFTILTLAMYVVWVVTGVWWPAIVLTAILLIVIVPIYFATYYELTRTELRIYCGIFGKSVPYRSIISMTDAESIAPAFCLSHQRILIRYMEDDEIKSVYVSPANREQFRELVNAEINKSTEIYKNVPKTSMDKAIEKARAEKIVMTRPELRAVEIEQENAAQESRQVVDHELKKLDDVIGENTSREATPEQRKKAEQKLLAKIRKLKVKKDEREKRNSYKESKVQARVAAAQPKPETAEEHRAMLEEEKAKIKAAIENAKKDQYVPPKKTVAKPKSNEVDFSPVEEKQNKADIDLTATPQETKAGNATNQESEDLAVAKKEDTASSAVSTKATKTKIKKEKVEEAKKSKAVVKKTASKTKK